MALRVAALEGQLVPDSDILGALLVRQVAIASIRVERAYRHETALTAERMRRAAPEGVDALLGRLRALREKTEPRSFVAWDDAEGVKLDLCLGCQPVEAPVSRVGLLTRGIVSDF